MTTTASNTILQVSPRQAEQRLPTELAIDADVLEIGSESSAEKATLGREARRFRATWRKGASGGGAYVEIRPTSKLSSELVVGLDSPNGSSKLFPTKQALQRLATLFADALRYDIETRTAEEADGFATRRTSAALVRARTA